MEQVAVFYPQRGECKLKRVTKNLINGRRSGRKSPAENIENERTE